MKKVTKKNKLVIYIIHFFFIILNITLLITSLISLVFNNYIYKDDFNTFMGISYSLVPTTSMEPTINKGEYVLINRWNTFDNVVENYYTTLDKYKNNFDVDSYKKFSIIVYNGKDYYGNSEYILHRVNNAIDFADGTKLIVKGDNNTFSDNDIVTKDNYIGTYIKKINKSEVQIINLMPYIIILLFIFNQYIIRKTKKQ